MNSNKGFKVIENVQCRDKTSLQEAVTSKVSRIISTEFHAGNANTNMGIKFNKRSNTATYG